MKVGLRILFEQSGPAGGCCLRLPAAAVILVVAVVNASSLADFEPELAGSRPKTARAFTGLPDAQAAPLAVVGVRRNVRHSSSVYTPGGSKLYGRDVFGSAFFEHFPSKSVSLDRSPVAGERQRRAARLRRATASDGLRIRRSSGAALRWRHLTGGTTEADRERRRLHSTCRMIRVRGLHVVEGSGERGLPEGHRVHRPLVDDVASNIDTEATNSSAATAENGDDADTATEAKMFAEETRGSELKEHVAGVMDGDEFAVSNAEADVFVLSVNGGSQRTEALTVSNQTTENSANTSSSTSPLCNDHSALSGRAGSVTGPWNGESVLELRWQACDLCTGYVAVVQLVAPPTGKVGQSRSRPLVQHFWLQSASVTSLRLPPQQARTRYAAAVCGLPPGGCGGSNGLERAFARCTGSSRRRTSAGDGGSSGGSEDLAGFSDALDYDVSGADGTSNSAGNDAGAAGDDGDHESSEWHVQGVVRSPARPPAVFHLRARPMTSHSIEVEWRSHMADGFRLRLYVSTHAAVSAAAIVAKDDNLEPSSEATASRCETVPARVPAGFTAAEAVVGVNDCHVPTTAAANSSNFCSGTATAAAVAVAADEGSRQRDRDAAGLSTSIANFAKAAEKRHANDRLAVSGRRATNGSKTAGAAMTATPPSPVRELVVAFSSETRLVVDQLEPATVYEVTVEAFFEDSPVPTVTRHTGSHRNGSSNNSSSRSTGDESIRTAVHSYARGSPPSHGSARWSDSRATLGTTLPQQLPNVTGFSAQSVDPSSDESGADSFHGYKLQWTNPRWPPVVRHTLRCGRAGHQSEVNLTLAGDQEFVVVGNDDLTGALQRCTLISRFSKAPHAFTEANVKFRLASSNLDVDEGNDEIGCNSYRYKTDALKHFVVTPEIKRSAGATSIVARFGLLHPQEISSSGDSAQMDIQFSLCRLDNQNCTDYKTPAKTVHSFKDVKDQAWSEPLPLLPWTRYVLKYYSRVSCYNDRKQTRERSIEVPVLDGPLPAVTSLAWSVQAQNSTLISWRLDEERDAWSKPGGTLNSSAVLRKVDFFLVTHCAKAVGRQIDAEAGVRDCAAQVVPGDERRVVMARHLAEGHVHSIAVKAHKMHLKKLFFGEAQWTSFYIPRNDSEFPEAFTISATEDSNNSSLAILQLTHSRAPGSPEPVGFDVVVCGRQLPLWADTVTPEQAMARGFVPAYNGCVEQFSADTTVQLERKPWILYEATASISYGSFQSTSKASVILPIYRAAPPSLSGLSWDIDASRLRWTFRTDQWTPSGFRVSFCDSKAQQVDSCTNVEASPFDREYFVDWNFTTKPQQTVYVSPFVRYNGSEVHGLRAELVISRH